MRLHFRLILMCCFFCTALFGEIIETFYGPINVEEPVLLELIHCPSIQRLKHIHQYGVAYYTTHDEEYNRFDHSIGVFALLRKNGASLEEQIAGLLHDVSHTVFSHVGDWVFGKEYHEDDYHNTIFKLCLWYSGIEKILFKYGFTINHVFPKRKEFPMLEQSLPNLCADRIDYNIQGAYYQKFLTQREAVELYDSFKFIDGYWISHRLDLLRKMVKFSIHMTEHCWGAPDNYVASRCLGNAIVRGLDIGLISWYEVHFGIDQDIWNKLSYSEDLIIQEQMHMVNHAKDFHELVDPLEADIISKFRCRGVDPWVVQEGQIVRLSVLDEEIARELNLLKEKADKGWPIKLKKN